MKSGPRSGFVQRCRCPVFPRSLGDRWSCCGVAQRDELGLWGTNRPVLWLLGCPALAMYWPVSIWLVGAAVPKLWLLCNMPARLLGNAAGWSLRWSWIWIAGRWESWAGRCLAGLGVAQQKTGLVFGSPGQFYLWFYLGL
jgi:hypothetical protein